MLGPKYKPSPEHNRNSLPRYALHYCHSYSRMTKTRHRIIIIRTSRSIIVCIIGNISQGILGDIIGGVTGTIIGSEYFWEYY